MGGGCTWSGGVYLVPAGCTCLRGVPGPRGVYLPREVHLVLGGVPGLGGVYLVLGRGVYLVLGGVPGPGGCVPGPRGCTWSWGGVPVWGCTCSGGVSGPGWVHLVLGDVPGQVPPCEQND